MNKYADALSVIDYVTGVKVDADLEALCGDIVVKLKTIIYDNGLDNSMIIKYI